MDYYIKTADEAALWQSLEAACLAYKQFDQEDHLNKPTGKSDWVPTGAFVWVAKCQLDIIGIIHIATGEMEEVDGRQIPITQAIDGFHANLRGELTEEQKAALPLIDAPATPVRVWA